MRKIQPPNFSQIVCGSTPVREAFELHTSTNAWWRLILALHGKPVHALLSQQQKTEWVADGFHFYASLYRGLGLLFLLLAPIIAILPNAEMGISPTYFTTASLMAGFYLWFISGLGYAGANSYRSGEKRGRIALIGFMVMVVAFLSLFVAAVSVIAQYSSPLPTALNLSMTATLFVFGIGSYLIEIVYLATEA